MKLTSIEFQTKKCFIIFLQFVWKLRRNCKEIVFCSNLQHFYSVCVFVLHYSSQLGSFPVFFSDFMVSYIPNFVPQYLKLNSSLELISICYTFATIWGSLCYCAVKQRTVSWENGVGKFIGCFPQFHHLEMLSYDKLHAGWECWIIVIFNILCISNI